MEDVLRRLDSGYCDKGDECPFSHQIEAEEPFLLNVVKMFKKDLNLMDLPLSKVHGGNHLQIRILKWVPSREPLE